MIARGEETRARIRDAALELFKDKGFDGTTMREIAVSAGVATGAAYYYFPSKEALVLEFYAGLQSEIEERLSATLERHRNLAERLRAILDLKFGLLKPNRRFLGALVRAGLDSGNPVSPFSEETGALRERSIANFRRVLEGSDVKIPTDLAPHLPRLLWLYYMGLILFWLYDTSQGQKKTGRLIQRSLDLVVTAIKLSRFRVLNPLRRTTLDLLGDVLGPNEKVGIEGSEKR